MKHSLKATTKPHPYKEKFGSGNEVSEDDNLDGTSARTRPISFDDIMLRRKNRQDAVKDDADGLGGADISLTRDTTEKASHSLEYNMQIIEDTVPSNVRHASNDSQKVSSPRKGKTDYSRKDYKLVTDNKRSQDRDAALNRIGRKTLRSTIVFEGKNVVQHHNSSKEDGFLGDTPDEGSGKRKARDLLKTDRVSDIRRGKSKTDREHPDDEKRKRKMQGQRGSDGENDSKKRNERIMLQTDKSTDRGRDKSEKGNRHKRHGEGEDKIRGIGSDKKYVSETRGHESTRVYLEESRSKRRRSRSREHDKERGRRSLSHSPKALKHTSKDKREHGEVLLHSTKDRAGTEHPDVDKRRISSNGSSSHYRRNSSSTSGLGGYSPRKRKTDAAAKTPSPTCRSPDRRTAGWDLQPVDKGSMNSGSTLSSLHTTSQTLLLNMNELPRSMPVTPAVVNAIGISHHILSSQARAIESVQLTQATRPMRRLYVENLPASASEKDLIECINKYFMGSGANYVQGTQPCLSCIIHKEKGQALLEFLTPEDASAALSLNGIFFSGSNLKLRRPKDYANVTTGLSDKSEVAVDAISGVVEDSPHKIFVGGISKLISSEMLLEIAKSFGPVKSYHFGFIADMNEPCAFLEYIDHSVTSKACAGLNGMRLGGQVLTAVLATPDVVLGNSGKVPPPFYGIPDHAKPLLENPTAVLQLKNVLDPEGILSLSELELGEILEDIKQECSRFGIVKSINVAKPMSSVGVMEACEAEKTNSSDDDCKEFNDRSYMTEQLGERIDEPGEPNHSEPLETLGKLENGSLAGVDDNVCDNTAGIAVEVEDVNRSNLVGVGLSDETTETNIVKDETCKPASYDEDISVKDPYQGKSSGVTAEIANQQNAIVNELGSSDNISERTTQMEASLMIEEELKLEENNANIASIVELDTGEREDMGSPEESNEMGTLTDPVDMFEPGSIYVEYKRAEAASMAAHCLHGRTFDGRVVTVGYVSHDLYKMRFHG